MILYCSFLLLRVYLIVSVEGYSVSVEGYSFSVERILMFILSLDQYRCAFPVVNVSALISFMNIYLLLNIR